MLDEPAACRMDYLRKDNIDEMNFDFGGSSLFKYNHTQTMTLPGPDNEKNAGLVIRNDGDYSIYVRCQDANGNFNQDAFSIRFCVEPGPDTTPPRIEAVDVPSNSVIMSATLKE